RHADSLRAVARAGAQPRRAGAAASQRALDLRARTATFARNVRSADRARARACALRRGSTGGRTRYGVRAITQFAARVDFARFTYAARGSRRRCEQPFGARLETIGCGSQGADPDDLRAGDAYERAYRQRARYGAARDRCGEGESSVASIRGDRWRSVG